MQTEICGWLGFMELSRVFLNGTGYQHAFDGLRLRQKIHAILEAPEHAFNGSVLKNVFLCVPGKLGSRQVIVEQIKKSTLERSQIILRNHEPVPPGLQIADFRRVFAFLGYHRETPVEGLIEPQSHMTRNGTYVSHFAQIADAEVVRIVDFDQLQSVEGNDE